MYEFKPIELSYDDEKKYFEQYACQLKSAKFPYSKDKLAKILHLFFSHQFFGHSAEDAAKIAKLVFEGAIERITDDTTHFELDLYVSDKPLNINPPYLYLWVYTKEKIPESFWVEKVSPFNGAKLPITIHQKNPMSRYEVRFFVDIKKF